MWQYMHFKKLTSYSISDFAYGIDEAKAKKNKPDCIFEFLIRKIPNSLVRK